MGAVKNKLSVSAKKAVKENRIHLSFQDNPNSRANKYSKPKMVKLLQGYDLCENLLLVRPYIQHRYNIQLKLLELLLYLKAKLLFTQDDYREIPKNFTYRSIRSLLDLGYVDTVQKGENLGKNVYTLSRKGVEIVKHFYECLSGEKRIPENFTNPLSRPSANTLDKKRYSLIKKLNQLPAPESKKSYYQ